MAKNKPSSGNAQREGGKLQRQQASKEKREAKQAQRDQKRENDKPLTSGDPEPWRRNDHNGGEGS